MNMISIAADTSALVSLEITNLLELSSKYFNFFVTEQIVNEIKEMSQYEDSQGKAAKRILKLIESGTIKAVKIKDSEKHLLYIDKGEAEILELALKQDIDYIISDDYEAFWYITEKFFNTVFSVFVVFYLCKKGAISKEKGWEFIKKIREKRTWGDNILYRTAKEMWRDLD